MARIVVGVDDSPEAAAALRWALDEARLRQAPLEVVHSWLFPALGDVPGAAAETLTRDLEEGARRLVDEVVAGVIGSDPGIPVERRVREGSAAAVLLDAASGADLLVLGSRGRGGFAGLLLGSVTQHCVHHAPCPVVVVRPPSP